MTETNKKKPRINPGLVRSDLDYKQSKTSAISNPTKQVALVALPTAEKENTFTEMYADSLKLSWLPLTTENIVIPIEIEDKPVVQPKAKTKKRTNKQTVKADKVNIEPKKVVESAPTDMEILMAQSAMMQEAPKVQDRFTEPVEFINLPETPQKEETNVFESINAIPVSQETKSNTKEERDKLVTSKPYMKIDKVEVRMTTNSDGETVYMIGKDILTGEQFTVYIQGIYGKILANDCKRIELQDMIYNRQGNGTYKDSNGKILTADELISKFSN